MKKLLIIISLVLLGSPALAGELTVGWGSFAPMSFDRDRVPGDVYVGDTFVDATPIVPVGFDIDLMNAVAADNGYRVKYVRFGSVTQRLRALESGKIDVAISGITITSSREAEIDFTHPYFNSGLKVLVRAEEASSTQLIKQALFDTGLGKALLYFLLFMVVCGHILWYAERGADDQIRDDYFPGVLDALWCVFAIMTTIGFGDIAPKKALGRIMTVAIATTGISFFCWFAGVFVISLDTLTEVKPMVEISTVADLAGKIIASKEGTTSADVIKKNRGRPWLDSNIEDSMKALESGDAEAILFDAPYILQAASKAKKLGKPFVTSDAVLQKEQYGFAVKQGSPSREFINRSLIKLKENGTYDIIYKKWFGE